MVRTKYIIMTEEQWSAPESVVLTATRELIESDRTGVLATVIGVEGNAYRRPGAKMLIPSDGDGIGSITAGCLEDEVLNLANQVLSEGNHRVETFDLMGDDDVWGLNVGCNGVIDLLLEPVDTRFRPLLDAYNANESVARLTVLESNEPEISDWQTAYASVSGSVKTTAEPLPEWFRTAVSEQSGQIAANGKADTLTITGPDGNIRVFADGITPPPKLVLVGTGHDVAPAVDLGKKNDFKVSVVGFRGAQADSERFPKADHVTSTSPAVIRDAVDIDEDTYVVVMTHNFIDDRLAVDELVKSATSYIGLMGPRNRFEEMLTEFEAEGREFSQAELESVYTPVGLDLGGGTPYQIAHSIISEVLAIHNDRQPRHLKKRDGPIHRRAEDNQSSSLSPQ